MSTRRLWYVLPLDIAPDPNQPIVMMDDAVQAVAAEDVLEPVRPRNQRVQFNANEALQANVRAPQPAGGRRNAQQAGQVFKIDAASRKQFTEACTTEALAFARAEQRAALEPKRPFGVFSCIGVVETMEAPLIRKEFNDVGELRVKTQGDDNVDAIA